jgi:TonB family protein
MRSIRHTSFRVLMLLSALTFALDLGAQTTTTSDIAISQLAGRLGEALQNAHAKKIIFADLRGPNDEKYPAGRWLAIQLANACSKEFPSLETVLRPEDAASENTPELQKHPPKNVEDWARRMGAKVVIKGTFARYPEGVGVSLTAFTASKSPSYLANATGVIPVTENMTELFAEPIPPAADSTARAGVGGVGLPECIYCPIPKYTSEARSAGIEGTVVLQVTITADGYATNITVVRDPGNGLGQKAVDAVRQWKFRPATGPSGRPVAVSVPIQVTFRLR